MMIHLSLIHLNFYFYKKLKKKLDIVYLYNGLLKIRYTIYLYQIGPSKQIIYEVFIEGKMKWLAITNIKMATYFV